MQDSYVNEPTVLEEHPPVVKEQITFMHDLGFRATGRKGTWILWELTGWPEVLVPLQGFQTDLSTKYILMQVFKSGSDSGKVFQINEFRLNLGFSPMAREDAERLSAFQNPWLGVYMNPRHES